MNTKKKKTNKNSANFISSKLSGCVIASCPTVVLASLDTFHTKCKPLILYAVILVKNSNIVTVFSTYINIICTRQQTGVSLSLAILAPPHPPSLTTPFFFLFPFSTPSAHPAPILWGRSGVGGMGAHLSLRTKRLGHYQQECQSPSLMIY